MAIRFLARVAALAMVTAVPIYTAGAQVPTADEALKVSGFSEAEKNRILAGQFVEKDRAPTEAKRSFAGPATRPTARPPSSSPTDFRFPMAMPMWCSNGSIT